MPYYPTLPNIQKAAPVLHLCVIPVTYASTGWSNTRIHSHTVGISLAKVHLIQHVKNNKKQQTYQHQTQIKPNQPVTWTPY